MPIRTYYLEPLAHASYLVWDETTKEAALVDPQRDIDRYLEDAKRLGLSIRHVLLTHLHADFVAGHLEAAALAGATIRLGPKAEVEYDERPFGEQDEIALGPSVRLRALETPGHTPESITILVFDAAEASGTERPHAALTGDTLFVGDVGRPDLRVALGWKAETLAGMLFDSLQEKILRLPDETLVLPAHGAGSACGKALSQERSSTIGAQRRTNYALQAKSKDDFARLVLADQADPPAYFTYDAVYNTKRRPTLEGVLMSAATRLTLDDARARAAQGAVILDGRDEDEYAAGHVPGSISVGLDGAYETWVGSTLDPRGRYVVLAPEGREREAAVRLGRIGFDGILGTLPAQALAGRGDLARMERIEAGRFVAETREDRVGATVVLDVRRESEWRAGHVPGAIHIPLGALPERMGEVPREGRLVVHCGGGYRSVIAASLLRAKGREAADVIGGMRAMEAARRAAGLPGYAEAGAAAGASCKLGRS